MSHSLVMGWIDVVATKLGDRDYRFVATTESGQELISGRCNDCDQSELRKYVHHCITRKLT